MPPQNIYLVCELFQAENNQDPKDPVRNFGLPQLQKKKNLVRVPVPRTELQSEIFVKYMAWYGRGNS